MTSHHTMNKNVYIMSLPNSRITKVGVSRKHPRYRAEQISLSRSEPVRVIAYAEVSERRSRYLERALKQSYAPYQLPFGHEWLNIEHTYVLRTFQLLLMDDEYLMLVRYSPGPPKPEHRTNERYHRVDIMADPKGIQHDD